MSKVRVHEYAKKVNKTSKEVIDQLVKFDMKVTNHMSTLEADAVTKLDSVFKQESEPKKATPTEAPAGESKKKSSTIQARRGDDAKSAPKQGNKQVNKVEGSFKRLLLNIRNKIKLISLLLHKINRLRTKNNRMKKVTITEI